MATNMAFTPNGDLIVVTMCGGGGSPPKKTLKSCKVTPKPKQKPKRAQSDYIYLCREERYGRNGNLRSLRKADMTPDVVRTYFWGFIRKYWRELLWIKN